MAILIVCVELYFTNLILEEYELLIAQLFDYDEAGNVENNKESKGDWVESHKLLIWMIRLQSSNQ